MTTFRASAPVRLDFAGGWTDVAPFATAHGGVVVNAAISLRARVEVRLGGNGYHAVADDLGQSISGPTVDALQPAAALPLHRAALRSNKITACALRSGSDAPPGSGLGSSGAMGVALQHALDLARGQGRSAADTAELAWESETRVADVAGGKQDQYAAALGGFNRLTFTGDSTRHQRLALDPEFASELEQHLLLCYTGQSRMSGETITRVMAAFERGDPVVGSALRAMADIAEAMTSALVRGSLFDIGTLLQENWVEQQRLDPGMCTPAMARLEGAMRATGAIGAKAAGSGAGGSMFFLVPGSTKPARDAATALSVALLPFRWAADGMRGE